MTKKSCLWASEAMRSLVIELQCWAACMPLRLVSAGNLPHDCVDPPPLKVPTFSLQLQSIWSALGANHCPTAREALGSHCVSSFQCIGRWCNIIQISWFFCEQPPNQYPLLLRWQFTNIHSFRTYNGYTYRYFLWNRACFYIANTKLIPKVSELSV